MSSDFLWVEKYRPKIIEDVILPENLSEQFKHIVKIGELPNMLFTGSAGTGKTTVAKALCKELSLEFILINASEEGNIDTLRNQLITAIETAVESDITRSSNALDTMVVSCETDEGSLFPVGGIRMTIRCMYEYQSGTP